MHEMSDKPLLSLCIPTYNRAEVLDETLRVLFADPDFDPLKVEVVVCDNCSEDRTPEVAARYPLVRYFRNEENIRDANFSQALQHGSGEYLKLMNDTVRLVPGGLKLMLDTIEDSLASREPLFFYEWNRNLRPQTVCCPDVGSFLCKASVRVTWIANFGCWRRNLPVVEDRSGAALQLLQVVWSIRIVEAGPPPVKICFGHYCTVAAGKGAPKGGYNVFRVFVANYLSLVEECRHKGVITRAQYRKTKFGLFRHFVSRRVVWLLFRSKHITGFDNRGAWQIVLEHYGCQPYFYLITFYKSLHYLLRGCR